MCHIAMVNGQESNCKYNGSVSYSLSITSHEAEVVGDEVSPTDYNPSAPSDLYGKHQYGSIGSGISTGYSFCSIVSEKQPPGHMQTSPLMQTWSYANPPPVSTVSEQYLSKFFGHDAQHRLSDMSEGGKQASHQHRRTPTVVHSVEAAACCSAIGASHRRCCIHDHTLCQSTRTTVVNQPSDRCDGDSHHPTRRTTTESSMEDENLSRPTAPPHEAHHPSNTNRTTGSCYFYRHHHHHSFPHCAQRQSLQEEYRHRMIRQYEPEAAERSTGIQVAPLSTEPIANTLTRGVPLFPEAPRHDVEREEEGLCIPEGLSDETIVVDDQVDQFATVEDRGLMLHASILTTNSEDGQQQPHRRLDSDGSDHPTQRGGTTSLSQVRCASRGVEAIARQGAVESHTDHRNEVPDGSATVLVFVYGTLKRGYCNHYNLESDGITYLQDGITIHPYIMYLDSANRSRPCLTDGSSCPINELIDQSGGSVVGHSFDGHEDRCGHDSTSLVDTIRDGQRLSGSQQHSVCPFCWYRKGQRHLTCVSDTQQQQVEEDQPKHHLTAQKEPTETKRAEELKGDTEQHDHDDKLSPSTKYRNSKRWGLPVRGELYLLNATLLAELDRFERVPAHYVRQTIIVKGLEDREYYNAQVYFNKTSMERWCELLDGRFLLLRDYTLEHHRLYRPRDGNRNGFRNFGLCGHPSSAVYNRCATKV